MILTDRKILEYLNQTSYYLDVEVLVTCPRCGESEDLFGRTLDGEITVSCESCGLTWVRDLQPRCLKCDSKDVRPAYEAIVNKSRGTQLSMQSAKLVYLCQHCDAVVLAEYQITNSPLMPEDLPTE